MLRFYEWMNIQEAAMQVQPDFEKFALEAYDKIFDEQGEQRWTPPRFGVVHQREIDAGKHTDAVANFPWPEAPEQATNHIKLEVRPIDHKVFKKWRDRGEWDTAIQASADMDTGTIVVFMQLNKDGKVMPSATHRPDEKLHWSLQGPFEYDDDKHLANHLRKEKFVHEVNHEMIHMFDVKVRDMRLSLKHGQLALSSPSDDEYFDAPHEQDAFMGSTARKHINNLRDSGETLESISKMLSNWEPASKEEMLWKQNPKQWRRWLKTLAAELRRPQLQG
jgi:hypothetical protein